MTPRNLHLSSTSKPINLVWKRPYNIPHDVGINYTVTISSISDLSGTYTIVNETQFSLDFIMEALAHSEECESFRFDVVATVPNTKDSEPATLSDTFPFRKCVDALNTPSKNCMYIYLK